MVNWVQVIETAEGTSHWVDLDKATTIEIAVSRHPGNELFYVKAKLPEGGRDAVYDIGKFPSISEAEDFIRAIIARKNPK